MLKSIICHFVFHPRWEVFSSSLVSKEWPPWEFFFNNLSCTRICKSWCLRETKMLLFWAMSFHKLYYTSPCTWIAHTPHIETSLTKRINYFSHTITQCMWTCLDGRNEWVSFWSHSLPFSILFSWEYFTEFWFSEH